MGNGTGSGTRTPAGQRALRARVQRIIRRFSGRAGVAARNLTTGETLYINEAEVFPSLSSIKVAIMAELFFRIDQGNLSLTDRLTVKDADIRGGTGVLRELDMPLELTVRDVCMLMMIVSDNSCTWMMSNRLGRDRINARMRSLGLDEIELRSNLSATTFDEMEGHDIDAYSASSARDFTALVTMMAQGELVSAEASEQMLDIMGRCQHIDYLGRYLPINQFPAESKMVSPVTMHNKIGAYLHGRCDTALIETPTVRYTATVMTAYSTDPSLTLSTHEGVEAVGRISRVIYDAWV